MKNNTEQKIADILQLADITEQEVPLNHYSDPVAVVIDLVDELCSIRDNELDSLQNVKSKVAFLETILAERDEDICKLEQKIDSLQRENGKLANLGAFG